MDRLIDKLIVCACCCAALLFAPASTPMLAGALLAITATALYEAFCEHTKAIACAPLAFATMAAFVPEFAMFLPFAAYDCMREENKLLKIAWALALLFALRGWQPLGIASIVAACAVACLLSLRTNSIERERREYRKMRDGVREASLSLEAKNRDLQAAQDMQVRLATLSERSRIAREIHDNVGHLLTRAIMQVEALQVVHADEPRTRADFADVGHTLHDAMDEVRKSVHDLRDESLDVREQIEEAIEGCGIAETNLDYEAGEIPASTGYCFLAIVREALSNTARHSDASRVDVRLVEYPGLYQLSVSDNGSIRPAPADAGHGMGLSSMEDRVRALGGTFRTEYRDGFRVLASIPRESTASAENSEEES